MRMSTVEFMDWIKHRDADNNWITVALYTKSENTEPKNYSNYMVSVLIKNSDINSILNSSNWSLGINFGSIEINDVDGNLDCIIYDEECNDGVKFNPFVLARHWYDQKDTLKFELIQKFILFYNLKNERNGEELIAFKDSGERILVVKIIDNDHKQEIQISTEYLKNYLSFINCALIRFHDRRITYTENICEDLIDDEISESNYKFSRSITDFTYDPKFKLFSSLRGKDIIRSFEKKKDLLCDKKTYEKFIINVTDDGELIEYSCDPNYLNLDGDVKFMTQVYFKKEVLKKYYDKPSEYTVTDSQISCGGYWIIRISENTAGLIQVYLGDLGENLPVKEQSYWKAYNVKPEGVMPRSRYEQDVMGCFAVPESPLCHFYISLKKINVLFNNKYKFELFEQLQYGDEVTKKSLRLPLNDESSEFEEQILHLVKLLVETINVSKLKKHITKNKPIPEDYNGSIKILKCFMNLEKIDSNIYGILCKIQNIRSAGIAHKKGKKYIQIMKEYNKENVSNSKFIENIIIELTDSFNALCKALSK